ncbi:hypothetical protein [Halomonas korlensis]|uniref:Uncharacterized protein n=1 Tax=Halomonas korlensis TaxID=463301 RepID=A0A1I7JLY3_9GAMM|nr:hypothetical protein [Halomonas korlensis]SFU86171.1 hypothetical protein SAMN04487955_11158 [Halomonas korlensis]
MTLYLLVFLVCLLLFGSVMAVLLLSGTPRYRTEPQQLIDLFDKALKSHVGESEWNAIIDYPIRHDDYLDGIRRRARRLMEEHGRHWRLAQGRPLLDEAGQEELRALREHLVRHTDLRDHRRQKG